MPLIKIEMGIGSRAKKKKRKKRSLNRKFDFHGFYTSRALDNETLKKKKRKKKKKSARRSESNENKSER